MGCKDKGTNQYPINAICDACNAFTKFVPSTHKMKVYYIQYGYTRTGMVKRSAGHTWD